MSEEQGASVVLLDRVVKGVLPEYCLHGQAECVRCRQWCHLGHRTQPLVASGEVLPLCMECAHELHTKEEWDATRTGRVLDHRRADGPHAEESPQNWAPCGNPTCSNQVAAPPPSSAPHRAIVSVCSPECAQAVAEAHSDVSP